MPTARQLIRFKNNLLDILILKSDLVTHYEKKVAYLYHALAPRGKKMPQRH